MTADNSKANAPWLARFRSPIPDTPEVETPQVRFNVAQGIGEVRSEGEWLSRLDHNASADASATRITEVKRETTDDS